VRAKEAAEYHGFLNFDPMIARPKPVQKPHPRIPTARGDVAEVLAKFRDMAREAGRDPASVEITSFGLGEALDRVKRFADLGLARVVASFPSEEADAVRPIVDRWTAIMRGVNG